MLLSRIVLNMAVHRLCITRCHTRILVHDGSAKLRIRFTGKEFELRAVATHYKLCRV